MSLHAVSPHREPGEGALPSSSPLPDCASVTQYPRAAHIQSSRSHHSVLCPTARHQFCLLYYDSSINSEALGKGCDIRGLTKAWVWERPGFCPFTWDSWISVPHRDKLVEPPAFPVLQSSSPVTLQSQIAQGVPRSGGPSENEMDRLIT